MKKILLSMLIPLFISCDKECVADLPACVQQWIDTAEQQDIANTPAEVNEYRYEGKTVYLLTAGCCDKYNELYDSHCNYICSPSGGVGGQGDGQCTDFFTVAKHVRLVWKDSK